MTNYFAVLLSPAEGDRVQGVFKDGERTTQRQIGNSVSKPIAHRFLLILILITTLPVALMGTASYHLARRTLIGTALMHMETIAEDHKNHLDFWYRERLQDLAVLASLPLVRNVCAQCGEQGCLFRSASTTAVIGAALSSVADRTPHYEALGIFTADGRPLFTTERGAPLPVEAAMNQEPGTPCAGKPFIGRPYLGPDHLWHVVIRSPVLNSAHQVTGSVVAVVNISHSLDPMMTDRAGQGKTGRTYLVTPQRQVITGFAVGSVAGGPPLRIDSVGIRRAIAGRSGAGIYRDYLGREVVGAYRWLKSYRLAIVAEMETAEILAPVQWIKKWTLGAVAILLGLCFAGATLAARKMSQPIVAMSRAARRMAEGDFSQTIEVSRGDELGALAASFNHMAQRIAGTMEELRANERSLRRAYEEQQALQAQLVHSEKLAAIGELVAGIVHEMRNPLSSVKLNLQIIKRNMPGDAQLGEHFSIALEQVALLEAMFRDLLNYSKPLRLTIAPHPLPGLVERARDQAEAEVPMNDVSLDEDFPAELPPVLVDEERVVQVLVNLFKNAVQNREGPLRLRLEASGPKPGNHHRPTVRLVIADNGPGIPPQHLPRLFQPFFTTRTKGTGLGLSIVRKIMDAHGGHVFIESEPGRGTRVILEFPAQGSEADANHSHH